jgi:N-acetylglutamate synthase-like GNAT family acetyltransferase
VLVGHVMFTVTELGDGTAILMLSPLAVLPPRQRHGVGSALVHEGLRRAAARDEPLGIVEGDPRYYSRFGFARASELGLERTNERIPEHAFQALRRPRTTRRRVAASATRRRSPACNRLLLDQRDGRPAPRPGPSLGGGAVERNECPGDLARRISPESADSDHEHLLFIG